MHLTSVRATRSGLSCMCRLTGWLEDVAMLIDCKYLWISQCFKEALWAGILMPGDADSSIVEKMRGFYFRCISAFFNLCSHATKVALKTCMVEWCECCITFLLFSSYLFSIVGKKNCMYFMSRIRTRSDGFPWELVSGLYVCEDKPCFRLIRVSGIEIRCMCVHIYTYFNLALKSLA